MRGGEGGSGSRGRVRAQRRGPSPFPPLDRPTQSLPLSLVQVTLEGHTGKQAGYMGVYELSAETDDGAPRFVKRLGNGKAQYLFRSSSDGTWVVTPEESYIATNAGFIYSLRAAELPSEAELGWKYYDESWKNDPDLRCTDVRTGAPSFRAKGDEESPDRPTTTQADSSPPTDRAFPRRPTSTAQRSTIPPHTYPIVILMGEPAPPSTRTHTAHSRRSPHPPPVRTTTRTTDHHHRHLRHRS